MTILDTPDKIKNLDSKNISGSIESLSKQFQQVWDEVSKIEFNPDFSEVHNIVVCGMGGSALGTHIIKSLYFDEFRLPPVEIVNGYLVPGDLDCDTLVILSSYSGTTEEVLAAYREAKLREAKIIVISSGGDLGELVGSGEIDGYVFEPKFNPSGQPRMGLGYSVMSQILILSKLGFIEFGEDHLKKIMATINQINENNKLEVKTPENKAKQTANDLFGKLPLLFASEHLVGNIHTFANQLNENAKALSAYYTLPEADHHLIEGLPSTDEIHKNIIFFFLNSNLYHPRVFKRYPITKELAEKAGYEVIEFVPKSASKLEQAFEFLTFGSWVSFYLAILYGRDPSPIPNVDFLKRELAK